MMSSLSILKQSVDGFANELLAFQEFLRTFQEDPEEPLKFIDLFCGVGGFHQALASLGCKCVLACDIDEKCRDVYFKNYGIQPHTDVTQLDTATMPDFDILCGGFPCQAFSHAGKQGGFEDTRGTLFRDVARILKDKQPRYFLLENVKNLVGHDEGRTWATIYASLTEVGYTTYKDPVVLSPHQIGVPQHRERVLIVGIRTDLLQGRSLPAFPTHPPSACSLHTILLEDDQVPPETRLNESDISVLNVWETFIQHFKSVGIKLPSFPLWSDDWDSDYDLKDLPGWKAKFVKQNRDFFTTHHGFLHPWLTNARTVSAFKGAKRKLEWQCGIFEHADSLWTLLFQFRPSGIRVKRATYSPALVALAQIVYVGEKKRKLSPREVARLQSFPDSFQLPTSPSVAYKQFGNSVNVDVIRFAAKHMLSIR
jgi:DNA (cytosine-5)-methyltransferase 1